MIKFEEYEEWCKTCMNVNKLVDVMIHHIEKENKKNEMSYLQSEVKVLYNLSPETDESNALDVILGISITE